MKSFIFLGLLILVSGCEHNDTSIVNKKIVGGWTLEQVYANDHWGGSLSWRNTTINKQVRFTSDLKYFIKTTDDFELIGTYQKISEEEIEITWDNPLLPEYPTYILNFSIDSEGRLTLSTGTFEGIVLEKYRRTEM